MTRPPFCSQAPGKAWGLRKPGKGILLASLSRGAEYSVFCITCPASRKRASSRCMPHLFGMVLNTIPLRSKLTAKAFLPSPAQPRVVVSLTAKRQGPCTPAEGPAFLFFRQRYQPFSRSHSIAALANTAAPRYSTLSLNVTRGLCCGYGYPSSGVPPERIR